MPEYQMDVRIEPAERTLAARLGPDGPADLRLWLSTTDYPKRFRP